MKSVIGIYENHEKAIDAIKKLQAAGYPVHQIGILAQGEIIAGEARLKAVSNIAIKEISVSVAMGSVLGVLTGVGLFAIPGLGFLFGAGALFGGMAGFEAGILGGGIAAALTSMGFELAGTKYEQHLNEGKFMVIVQGSPKEVAHAKHLLETHGGHIELNDH